MLALLAVLQVDNVWLLLCVFAVQQAFFAVNQPTRTAVIAPARRASSRTAGVTRKVTAAASSSRNR